MWTLHIAGTGRTVEAIVEFDYKAQHDDELTITVGDIISNIRKDEGGWWEGELAGRRGLFPDNFVREIKKEAKKECSQLSSGQRKAELSNGNTSTSPGFEPSLRSAKKGDVIRRRRCKVAFSYTPQNDDELELKLGDVIEILGEVEEGWWEGTLNGKTGMFPSNFTKLLPDPNDPPTPQDEGCSARTSLKDSTGSESDGGDSSSLKSDTGSVASSSEVQPKKVRGFGFGDIFKDRPIKLRPRSMEMDSEVEKAVKKAPPVPTAQEIMNTEPDSKSKVKELCKVLFPYEAQNEDELSIKEGEIVTIISKECVDTGWWLGELKGRQGVFPDNFVKLFVPEVEKERPKKPPPPTAPVAKPNTDRQLGTKPDAKLDSINQVPSKCPKSLPHRGEEKEELKITDIPKPALPGTLPKKPLPLKNANSLGHPPSFPPKRPERPAAPNIQGDRSKVEGEASTPDRGSSDKSSDIDVEDLDSIVSSTERLNHPTTSRPRMTDRRPRSQIFTSSSLSSLEAQDSQSVDEDRGEREEGQESPTSKGLNSSKKVPKVVSALPATEKSAVPPKPTSAPPSSSTGSQLASPPLPLVSEHLGLEELRAQLCDLRAAVELMKAQHRREMKQLRNEMDEERKIRLSLQVEVEHIKKALSK
ncbi:SH3 domain-containing kinase-binding protein 1 isoform X2 [Scleropages formosus]|uniref:SH3 domain-containing kinase-binding protein 1 isoform X2 n=1 Tax=Scleropages formosus TaxID=113540 RepID=UPI0008783EEA|nr:SH3 domain-containing kinase-binding protein 1 isoform X2 [Scleropages formosus]